MSFKGFRRVLQDTVQKSYTWEKRYQSVPFVYRQSIEYLKYRLSSASEQRSKPCYADRCVAAAEPIKTLTQWLTLVGYQQASLCKIHAKRPDYKVPRFKRNLGKTWYQHMTPRKVRGAVKVSTQDSGKGSTA